ncbi:MAG: hypothetical protein LBV12_03275, partial [Puniceicoccales bacterium]|nr:hypothetical protein [Puniceicoccales bacterium]
FRFTEVKGSQYAVLETWTGGVQEDPLPPKTYVFNRWLTSPYLYDMTGQIFVMNDKAYSTYGEGRANDLLEVKSADNQKVHFSITLRWHRDFNKLVSMHKTYRDQLEERLIRPEIIKTVVANATVKPALELYSGQSLESLRSDVEKVLKDQSGALYTAGVIVDAFIVDGTNFPDKQYVESIEARQRAIIDESRAKEEEKANKAKAEAAKAAALRLQYEQVVAAETKKKTAVLQQEAESEQATIKAKADALNAITLQEAESKKIVLQAKADADKQVALSEAAKQSEINRAAGIDAVGKATAEAQRLQLTAYSVEGSDLYAKIELGRSLAQAFTNVKGWLPQGVTYNTVAKDFESSVSLLLNSGVQPQATPPTKSEKK